MPNYDDCKNITAEHLHLDKFLWKHYIIVGGFQPSGQGGWACHHGGKGYKQQHDDDGKGGKGAVGSPPTMTQVVARAKTMAFSPVAKAKVIIMHIAVMPAIIVMLGASSWRRNWFCTHSHVLQWS